MSGPQGGRPWQLRDGHASPPLQAAFHVAACAHPRPRAGWPGMGHGSRQMELGPSAAAVGVAPVSAVSSPWAVSTQGHEP